MTSEYCGFRCSEVRQKQQKIIDELIDFNKYNPEYSKVMVKILVDMLTDTNTKFETGVSK